jgi:hypothetical protein
MRPRATFRLLIGTAIGFGVGWLMDLCLGHLEKAVFLALNYPAVSAARAWWDAGLPPYGCAKIVALYYTTLAQWTVLGFCGGLIWILHGRWNGKRIA